MKQECLVFRQSLVFDYRYSINLNIKDDSELEKIKEVLKPLGYTFRFPKRG